MSNGNVPKPKDGGGIKWSTLKRKVRRVTLENGETVELPVEWDAFQKGVKYVGYEVELEREVTVGGKKVTKIQVWVLVRNPAPPNGRLDWKGWCHGLTFDEDIYSPGGVSVPPILAAGWDEIDCRDLQRGDVIVYYNAAGEVTHSAVSNGNGTFTSKEGNTKKEADRTKAQMDETYDGTTKCYRKKK